MSGPELTDYQRGYVDGFDAPANVKARAAATPVESDDERHERLVASGRMTCDDTTHDHVPPSPEPTPGLLEAPFVVRQFEGQAWVPLREAVRLHEAHQDAVLTIAGLRNAAALAASPAPEARRAAIAAVVAHKASPPEYPGLALVPVSDIERLEQFARTSWRKASRALHSSGDDEPYATDREDGA